MVNINNNPASPLWWKAGWGVGAVICVLQLLTAYMPPGEQRDWLYYAVVAGFAALVTVSIPLARSVAPVVGNPPWLHGLRWFKMLCTAYGFLAISYYALFPLVDVMSLGVWVLALLLTDAWLKQRNITEHRLLYGAVMAWFLLCAYALCRSLLYRVPLLTFPMQGEALLNALPFVLALAFVLMALWTPRITAGAAFASPRLSRLLHVMALYVIAVPLFRTDQFTNPVAIHHWKALLEPVASVRSGGWLLWDVPSQYGFLQTLLLAVLPAGNAWQSMYLLNGALLTATGYLIFRTLFTKYHSLWGFFFCVVLAVSATALLFPVGNGMYFPVWSLMVSGTLFSFPTTGNPLILPSSGAMRFFWVYPVAGYVWYLCRFYYHSPRKILPRYGFVIGNALWLVGVLWSLESAVFVSLVWIPALVLIAMAESYSRNPGTSVADLVKHISVRVLHCAAMMVAVISIIALIYFVCLGHWPDVSLMMAYAGVYVGGFNVFSIDRLGLIACWLFVLGMMVGLCIVYLIRAKADAQTMLTLAVFYAVIAGLWAVASYYIPLSDDVHLVCTLPVLVYLSALLLVMMPQLDVSAIVKDGYEKAMLCLYGVIIWATAHYYNPALYSAQSLSAPVHSDVAELLLAPPATLQALLDKVVLPADVSLHILAQPYTIEEAVYFQGVSVQPWLLPNTLVGYDIPLPKALYRTLAERRAARTHVQTGWTIERLSFPLDHYHWIKVAIEGRYRQVQKWENTEYRLRKFERLPD